MASKKNLEIFIKIFIMFSLYFSLIYSGFPYVALLMQILIGTQENALLYAAIINLVLIIALWRYPEWYIVNLVGILVGAGVITMIGISFVPTLIIIFMIIAAIYDHWAVNGSKHMLELADTMIDLKLPILLVAPKEKGYSFLDEQEGVMEKTVTKPTQEDWDDPKIAAVKVEKSGRDALFGSWRCYIPRNVSYFLYKFLTTNWPCFRIFAYDFILWLDSSRRFNGRNGHFIWRTDRLFWIDDTSGKR